MIQFFFILYNMSTEKNHWTARQMVIDKLVKLNRSKA